MRLLVTSFFMLLLSVNGCKKSESYRLGSLGEVTDFDIQIKPTVLPFVKLGDGGSVYVYYLSNSNDIQIRFQNRNIKLATEELKDATLGGLRLIEDKENIYAFYWARYARGDIYKSFEKEIEKRREKFKEDLAKKQEELKSIAEEKKRIARETPEELKRKEEFKKEVEKIKSKYPDLKSEDINKRKEAYKQFIKEVSEKRKALLGDIEKKKKERLEALTRREMEIKSEIKNMKEQQENKFLVKNIFIAVIDKKSFNLKETHKITSDKFFPTEDISVGTKDGITLLAWTDERVEGGVGVCYTLTKDIKMSSWSEPQCLKGYIQPRIVDKGNNLFLYATKCDKEKCEHRFLLASQEGVRDLSTLKTNDLEFFLNVEYNGREYHIYAWGPQSFTLYSSKDLSKFEKLADSSSITDKTINMLLPVSTEEPKAVLVLKPNNPRSWIGINLDKPNIYLAEFSSGKVKLRRLQRNTEHLTTATNPAVGINSKGDIAVVWIDKRFLVPVPFVSFITRDGELYADNPLEDPRQLTVDQPKVISVGEEFFVAYPTKKIDLEKETARDIYTKPYFERIRKLKVTPVEYAFEVPSKDSLEKAFKDYAKARIEGDEKRAYQFFDPIFRLKLTYEQWKSQKVDIKFKDINLKKAEVLDNFGQVVYQAQVEFPEQIGKVVVAEKEKKYEAIDEVWVYLFGKWYYVPRTPISSVFYAEW